MDIVRLCIPYGFVRARVRMCWREVRFGLVNELVDLRAPVELALEQVAELEHPPAAVLELAGAEKYESTSDLVNLLADGEPEAAENEIRDKWLYLVLAWIREHHQDVSNPLQRVEEVYADFGYPEQIADFVRYMPTDEPDLGSREANERRLFERWKRYLDRAAARYAP